MLFRRKFETVKKIGLRFWMPPASHFKPASVAVHTRCKHVAVCVHLSRIVTRFMVLHIRTHNQYGI